MSTAMGVAYWPMRAGLVPGVPKEAADAVMAQAGRTFAANTPGEQAGKVAEQIGEFFLPAGRGATAAAELTAKLAPLVAKAPGAVRVAVSLAPKVATEAATTGAISAAQGGSPLAGAAVGAAGPVLGKSVEAAVPALRRSAQGLMEKALGGRKERYKAMASQVAPEILRRNVGGRTGLSRDALLEQATRNASAASKQIDAVLEQAGGNSVQTTPIVEALEQAKAAFRVPRSATAAELAANKKLAATAREVSPGQFEVDEVLDARPLRQLEQLQRTITNLGETATVSQIVAARRAWDNVVAQAGGFAHRAAGAIGVPLKDTSEAWAKREATTAIRKVLASDVPDLAAVNKEFAFWKNIKDVLRQTVQRTTPQEGSLGRNIMMAGGMVAGASSGEGVVDRAEKAFIFGTLAKRMDMVFRSPRWRMASAQMRSNLADAIAEGNAPKVTFFLNRISAAGVSQATR